MGSATNVDAVAVNTIDWLSAADTTIVVPVYQRQYRWDIGGCEQLLADVRAVAATDTRDMHFIGSILSARNSGTDARELVLIDGQQRITTLMLLLAALRHSVGDADRDLADQLDAVLVSASAPSRTKLRPHREWAAVFESVVLDRRSPADALRESRFDDNYAFFRSQVAPDEAPAIWRGVQRLEHVSITLGADANAQQIFESLNSTGEALRDHELIHNYILMGLSRDEQSEIEDEFWLPIERATGDQIGRFWRHYLIMTTGREVAVAGGRDVYDAFRHRFPRLDITSLRERAAEWRAYAEVYRALLNPGEVVDDELARQLAYVNTFGRGMYPLIMRTYRDFLAGDLDRTSTVAILEDVQALLLRRTIAGISNDRLVARLCRAREAGSEHLTHAISRIMPSDERVRVALKYADLPYATYVLGRIAGVDSLDGLELEYVFPPVPGDAWTGDGTRRWAELSEDEQNSHRALAHSLGNVTLLEEDHAEQIFGASFSDKRAAYSRSGITLTRELAQIPAWTTAAIGARTAALTARILGIWRRPATILIDDDGLTPILDAQRRRGWPPGWEREWEYVEYRGEHWEVHDVRHLFTRVFRRLWADSRDAVVGFSAQHGGPIFPAQAWGGQWEPIDGSHFLYLGWDSRYMLTAVQGVLDEAGIAPEVFVKYSYIGAAMS